MAHLLAVPTYNVPITTATKTTTTSALIKNVALRAFPRHVTRYITQVADGIILTITCQVTSLPAVLACLVICAVCSKMALLVAVIAQP